MATIHTDGRALADAAVLIRKVVGANAVAHLIAVDGRAEVQASAIGGPSVTYVVGHGSAGDGSLPFAADLAAFRTMRKVGPVTIRETADGATMTYGSVTARVGFARELPAVVAEIPPTPSVALDVRGDAAADVAASLRSVADAATTSDYARDVLRHVYLTSGEAAATDTYRLNVADVPVTALDAHAFGLIPVEWITAIPRRGVVRLTIRAHADGKAAGAAEVTFRTVTGRGDAARVSDVVITGRTNFGPFPNYRALTPSEGDLEGAPRATIPAGIADVLKGMSAPVMLTTGDAPNTLTVTDPNGMSATLGTATVGAMSVAANPDYVSDLAAHVGDGADLIVRDGLRAMVAEADGRTALLMPMRMS